MGCAKVKLSTKSHYGLNACYFLAAEYNAATDAHANGGGLPLKKLAQTSGISEAYLEQIILLLKKAGIIAANRGALGGYYLARPPEEILVGDIVRALEGNLEIVGCRTSACDCAAGINCKTKNVWDKVYKSINDTLDRIKLSDLRDENFL
ncbi:MAG: Rrf2 family transcriptional regulator [Clostridiales bacterium]|jgi:Rrf2 family protein|nr:Rrf2 family transcriptional regulator [Clostridiales bacterium]